MISKVNKSSIFGGMLYLGYLKPCLSVTVGSKCGWGVCFVIEICSRFWIILFCSLNVTSLFVKLECSAEHMQQPTRFGGCREFVQDLLHL